MLLGTGVADRYGMVGYTVSLPFQNMEKKWLIKVIWVKPLSGSDYPKTLLVTSEKMNDLRELYEDQEE